jgi:hypothetical protein
VHPAASAVLDGELKAGTDPLFIISAIGEVAVNVSKADPESAPANLEALAAIVNAAARGMRGRDVAEALKAALFG